MKRILALLSFLLAASQAWAGMPGRDPEEAYVTNPDRPFTIRLCTNYDWSKILTDGSGVSTALTSQHRAKTGLSMSYRGLGLSFNLGLKDKIKDNYSFSLHSYGKRFHVKFDYLRDNTYSGVMSSGGSTWEVPMGLMRHSSINGDVWYCFNGKNFSFPAVFTQTRIQRRSAGSFMLAATYKRSASHMEADAVLGLPKTDIAGMGIGLGGGYGYNLVLGDLLLHASVIGTFVVFSNNRVAIDSEASDLKVRFPNNISTANLAAIYNFRHFFMGATFSCNSCIIGGRDLMLANFLRMNSQFILGVRF